MGETLYQLETSFNNMKRMGFKLAYEREVYGYGLDS